MLATQRTQSVTDFRQKAAETLERINKTGEAEVLTVNGEARAVLVSPAAYDTMVREAELSQDVEMIRRSLKQIEKGQTRPAKVVFAEMRSKLLAMKQTAVAKR